MVRCYAYNSLQLVTFLFIVGPLLEVILSFSIVNNSISISGDFVLFSIKINLLMLFYFTQIIFGTVDF